MITKESWYKEALGLDLQWGGFERDYSRGSMDPERYRDWFNLALRTERLDDLPKEVLEQLPPDFVQGVLTLTPGMSLGEIRSVWDLSLQVNKVPGLPLRLHQVPGGLTLEMVKKSEKAGIQINVQCWIHSEVTAELEDGDWSLQYDGAVAPDLRTYNHNANQYFDSRYQLQQRPDKLLARLKRLGWSYSDDPDDGGVTYKREFETGRRFPGYRAISEWAWTRRVKEKLTLYFNKLHVYKEGPHEFSGGQFPYANWMKETFQS